MTAVDQKGKRVRRGVLAGTVSVVCGQCGRRGSTNKALGFKNNQKIEACRDCREKEPK